MTLEDLRGVAGPLGHAERVLLFGWWLHVHGGRETFMPVDITKCYNTLHLGLPPGSFGPYFASHSKKGGPLLKNVKGYRLENAARGAHEQKYGQAKNTIAITGMLAALPNMLGNLAERTYLDEAIACYKAGSSRAAITMTWNVAYAHLCDHIVRTKLGEFNARWLAAHGGDHKKGQRFIKTVDDFAGEELSEAKVLKLALDCGAVVKNVYNVLEPALKRRNAAAHPNNVILTPLQTEAFIEDLVNNAILKIA
jgi:hypothetical protein